jgi:hypothetical protein
MLTLLTGLVAVFLGSMLVMFIFFVVDEIWTNRGWEPHTVKWLPGGYKDAPAQRMSAQ